MSTISLARGRRAQLRLPLSPVRAQMALTALEEWRQPDAGDRRGWFVIRDAAGDTPAQVNIFDEISWWGVSAQEFCDLISVIDGDLEVHINSPGGDAFDGITIFNALAARKGKVTTVVDGLAASAASVIAMAGSERVMSPGSMMMIHDALAMCIGSAADMRETAALLDKVSDSIASVYAARAGKTAADWRAAMTGDAWYSAQEAVDAGLAHSVAAGDGAAAMTAAWSGQRVFAMWQGNPPVAAEPAKCCPQCGPDCKCMDSPGAPARAGVRNASADESDWDGPAAMSAAAGSEDPAAALDAICAGKRDGDPATEEAHALPHHKHPGDPPNRHGVSNALAHIGQTEGLTNEGAARDHLEEHQSAIGSGSSDKTDDELWAELADPEIWNQLTAGKE